MIFDWLHKRSDEPEARRILEILYKVRDIGTYEWNYSEHLHSKLVDLVYNDLRLDEHDYKHSFLGRVTFDYFLNFENVPYEVRKWVEKHKQNYPKGVSAQWLFKEILRLQRVLEFCLENGIVERK